MKKELIKKSEKLNLIVLVVLAFILGILANNLASGFLMDPNTERPFTMLFSPNGNVERFSPQDWIKEDQIHVFQDKIVLDIEDAEWASFTNTNSMDPFLDETSNAIEIVPEAKEQLKIGDVVSYQSEFATGTIIHRIIDIDEDEDGWFCKTKGDNNPETDPGKVRFNQIKRVLVGILY
ncbi:hypothetical protein ACFL1H_01335 [Nanoarchaeota archaeon]